MGFRIRKSFKLGKGGRFTLGSKGSSVSFGGRGARLNLGSKGARLTAGIPGTGISYSTRLGGSSRRSRRSASSGAGCVLVLILAPLLWIGSRIVDFIAANPWTSFIVVLAGLCIGIWAMRAAKNRRFAKAQEQAEQQAEEFKLQQAEGERARQERWVNLCANFGEEDAKKIVDGRLWVGCTVAAMIEIFGAPVAVDEKVLKTRVNRTYKYKQTAANRFALRIYVTNGLVTGWDDKSEKA